MIECTEPLHDTASKNEGSSERVQSDFGLLLGMDCWPADHRTQSASAVSKKNVKETIWNYPHLCTGSIGAVSLARINGRLEWTSATTEGSRELPL